MAASAGGGGARFPYAPRPLGSGTASNIYKTFLNFFAVKLNDYSYSFVSDLISIPDFVSGAMEHWGLITFRETNILFDPAEASSANQQRVATVVAHEVSHQVP